MDASEKLEAFLRDLGLHDKMDKFLDDEINMSNIADLTDEDLKGYEIKLGKRKDFLKAVKKLQQNGSRHDLDPNHETQHSTGYIHSASPTSGPQRTLQRQRKPNKEFSTNEVPRIVLMGTTGSGKSSLGNLLLGWEKFVVSNDPNSCTEETSRVERGFWRGHGEEFEIIDSPGLNDSEGRDTDHIANIVNNLKNYGHINAFAIVRNGQEPRLSRSYVDMFRIFEMAFGSNFWNNVIFDVSHGGDAHTTHKRWIKEVKNKFPNAANAKLKTVYVDVKDQDEELDDNLRTMWNLVDDMPKFECKNITAVMEEKDKLVSEKAELENKKEELEKVLDEERKKFENSKLKVEQEYDLKKAELEAMVKETREEKIKSEQALDEKIRKYEEEKVKDKEKLEIQMNEERQKFQKDLEDRNQADMERNIEIEKFKIKEDMKTEYDKKIVQLNDRLMTKNLEIEKLKMTKDKLTTDLDEEKKKNEDRHLKDEAIIIQLREDLKTKEEVHKQNLEQAKEKISKDEKKKTEQEKNKIEQLQKMFIESENEFREKYPSLFSEKGHQITPGLSLVNELKKIADPKQRVQRFQVDVNIPLKKKEDIKNRQNGIAARMFKTQYPSDMFPKGSGWLPGWLSGTKNEVRMKKTLMLLGLTGTGKTTFIDAFVNYIFDIRYEDPNRLRLIEMTKDEKAKKDSQSQSQTDHIVVYHIEAIPDMKIFFDLTIIDTPGFGDTRGIGYDKKLMQNIEDLFKSKKIESLDAIGFVVKAGDARLTAQQKYIFESILHIFGKDVEENLLSILTCYDGMKVNIFDSFEEANVRFVSNIPVNSEAIFQHNNSEPVTRKTLENNPNCVNYQDFFKSSEFLVNTLANMEPKSLDQTLEVLKDREHIEVEMQGLHEHVNELLIKKNMIAQETDICKRHEENANATEDTEYEVEEQQMKKVELTPGTYVTNCLVCNRTCHFPCGIPNDNGKSGCAAMRRGTNSNKNDPSPQNVMCVNCPRKCHWSQHVNSPYKIEFEVKKVKKTYEEIVKRHKEFIKKHRGQKTIIDALKEEAEGISKEIQGNVQKIMVCLRNLKQNALRPDSTSSSDYIEEMISAENQEKKTGYQARIKQLREEKDKADYLTKIQAGADPGSL